MTQRIVSLIPSSTEIVYALGLSDGLVGRSHECDFPAGVEQLPFCTAPKFNPDGRCYEIDQLMAAGNWMPELVEMAGGINLFGEAGKHSPWMIWDDLKAADPDVIVVLPCGYDMAKTLSELPALTSRPDWSSLRAVKENQV